MIKDPLIVSLGTFVLAFVEGKNIRMRLYKPDKLVSSLPAQLENADVIQVLRHQITNDSHLGLLAHCPFFENMATWP